MKHLIYPVIILLAVACGGGSDPEPKYTSLDGNWTYTFPDSKVTVTFTLTKAGDVYEISNSVVKFSGVNHTDHEARFIDIDDLSFIEQFYFDGSNASDPYEIRISGITTDSGFIKISATSTLHHLKNTEQPVDFESQTVKRSN